MRSVSRPVCTVDICDHWNLLRALRRVDIQVLNRGELGSFIGAQTRHNGDVLVALLQRSDGCAVDRSGSRGGDVAVGNAGKIGAIGIDLQSNLRALVFPLVI